MAEKIGLRTHPNMSLTAGWIGCPCSVGPVQRGVSMFLV